MACGESKGQCLTSGFGSWVDGGAVHTTAGEGSGLEGRC